MDVDVAAITFGQLHYLRHRVAVVEIERHIRTQLLGQIKPPLLAGAIHLTKSLAMEWAGKGIRVNSISPGYTWSPMNKRPEVAEQVKIFAGETPMGRLAEVSEMVGPAIFLLSGAASFCTGHDLVVDGGFVCW